jgi:hypothetical protein
MNWLVLNILISGPAQHNFVMGLLSLAWDFKWTRGILKMKKLSLIAGALSEFFTARAVAADLGRLPPVYAVQAKTKLRATIGKGLILLRHRARRLVRANLRAQHGHRGSRLRPIATANLRCSVAIESGTCRCGRIGGAAGSVTTG